MDKGLMSEKGNTNLSVPPTFTLRVHPSTPKVAGSELPLISTAVRATSMLKVACLSVNNSPSLFIDSSRVAVLSYLSAIGGRRTTGAMGLFFLEFSLVGDGVGAGRVIVGVGFGRLVFGGGVGLLSAPTCARVTGNRG